MRITFKFFFCINIFFFWTLRLFSGEFFTLPFLVLNLFLVVFNRLIYCLKPQKMTITEPLHSVPSKTSRSHTRPPKFQQFHHYRFATGCHGGSIASSRPLIDRSPFGDLRIANRTPIIACTHPHVPLEVMCVRSTHQALPPPSRVHHTR
jgi:hypothetical protein